MSAPAKQLLRERLINIGATLSWYRHGDGDPTTWLNVVGNGVSSTGEMVRAARRAAYGPGAAWMLEQAPRMLGVDNQIDIGLESDHQPAVARAARNGRSIRISGPPVADERRSSAEVWPEKAHSAVERLVTNA